MKYLLKCLLICMLIASCNTSCNASTDNDKDIINADDLTVESGLVIDFKRPKERGRIDVNPMIISFVSSDDKSKVEYSIDDIINMNGEEKASLAITISILTNTADISDIEFEKLFNQLPR